MCSPVACGTRRLAWFGGPGGTRSEAVRRPKVPPLHNREGWACWHRETDAPFHLPPAAASGATVHKGWASAGLP